MNEQQLLALISGAGIGLAALVRWCLKLWAKVRREGFEAAREAAVHQREDSKAMVQALLESARAQTELAAKIDQLPAMFELVLARGRDGGTGRTPKFEADDIDTSPLRKGRGSHRPRRAETRGDDDTD